MTREMKLLALAILTAAIAVIGSACETLHYDMYFGTDAGAGFDAPAREAEADDTGTAAGTPDGGVVIDAGEEDGAAGGD
jgi:hypothetical protein